MRLAAIGLFLVTTASADTPPVEHPQVIQIDTTDNVWRSSTKLFEFRTNGKEDCFITPDLLVAGRRRARCVELLEKSARLARAEMRVNERKRR
jgi:hypothetical protein